MSSKYAIWVFVLFSINFELWTQPSSLQELSDSLEYFYVKSDFVNYIRVLSEQDTEVYKKKDDEGLSQLNNYYDRLIFSKEIEGMIDFRRPLMYHGHFMLKSY